MADIFETKVAVYGQVLMQDFALPDFQAAGVFGNIGHECGGFKLMQELKPTVKGSRGGYGWAQWTGPRRVKFEAYCARNKLDPASDKANYAYLFLELKGDEFPAMLALKKTKTLAEATEVFCRTFERPGIVSMPARMQYANRALAAIRSAPKRGVSPTRDVPALAPVVPAVVEAGPVFAPAPRNSGTPQVNTTVPARTPSLLSRIFSRITGAA